MKYVIGIDGGGTHGKAVLCDEELHVLKEAISGPLSATGTPFEEAMANLTRLISEVSEGYAVDGLFAGISGCTMQANMENYTNHIRTHFPSISHVKVASDCYNVIYAELGSRDGIVTICGTGAVAFAQARGQLYRVDGDGYLLGDEGSGFWIGQKVLNTSHRMLDGRLEKGPIFDLVFERLGDVARPHNKELHEGGKTLIASFAPMAFQAMALGDVAAKRILEQAAQFLAEDISVAAKHIETEENIPVILCGSLWEASGAFIRNHVQEILGDGYALQMLSKDPAWGAARAALHP